MGCLNANIEIVSKGLDVVVYKSNSHITPTCSLICAVEMKWEEFVTQDNNVLHDANDNMYMVKKSEYGLQK